jgi:hypothetical protein
VARWYRGYSSTDERNFRAALREGASLLAIYNVRVAQAEIDANNLREEYSCVARIFTERRRTAYALELWKFSRHTRTKCAQLAVIRKPTWR